jgi:putative inorganic carbon (hco3(-)) transporter
MRFALTVLLVSILYLRPWELVEGYEELPVYQVVILLCLGASAGPILRQLTPSALAARPITVCVLGLFAAAVLSLLARGDLGAAVAAGSLVSKLVLLYLLLVANIDSVPRLRAFFRCLGGLIAGLTLLSLAQYHGLVNIAALEAFKQQERDAAGEVVSVLPRICGPGIFHDPNDLCVLLAMGVIVSLYCLGDRRLGWLRYGWLAPLAAMGYAVSLTHSRGGLIALGCGLLVLFQTRWGWKKAALLGVLAAPALLVALGGRMTNFDLDSKDDTSQLRLHHWSDGLILLRSSPVLGIGQGRYVDEVGITAHNSYVEVFTQTGLLGGTFFVGVFAYGFWTLHRVGRAPQLKPDLKRLRPYVLAILATLAGGMLSLSRDVTPPTYVIFGLVAAYLRLAAPAGRGLVPRLTPGLAGRAAALGVVALVGLHTLTVLLIRR